jgi:geranylgeranyl pyrophosphate synthase
MSVVAPAPAALPRLHDVLADELEDRLGRDVPTGLWRRALIDPVTELTRRPGKEVRARLCELAWALGGGHGPVPEPVTLTIEALHAGSLIIDDVEDDARERRGAPALHLLVGVPLAINTGSWLYFWALDRLATLELPAAVQLAMHQAAIRALLACHQGQALDLAVRVDELEHARVGAVTAAITAGKTACLIGLAMRLAALAAGAPPARVAAIARLGEDLGTGLQMLDDLGGLGRAPARQGPRGPCGPPAPPGRGPGWPRAADDLTWSRLQHRLRLAREHADTDTDTAELEAIASALRHEIEAVGRARVRTTLDQGFARALAALGDGPHLRALEGELRCLEESYG